MGVNKITDKTKTGLALTIVIFLAFSAFVSAQNNNFEKAKNFEIDKKVFTYEFSMEDFEFSSFQDYDVITLKDGGILNEIGKPMVPLKNVLVALPGNFLAEKITILDMKQENLPGSFLIIPAQSPKRLNEKNDLKISCDSELYSSNLLYPSDDIKLSLQTDLAGQAIAVVSIYPIHYNPFLKKISIISKITFEIEGCTGYICGDYLPSNYDYKKQEQIKTKIQGMVINPEDVNLKQNDAREPLGVPPGNFDYVIITKPSWEQAFSPLSDWKTQKGYPSTIVNTTWIYSSYSGSSNKAKIRAFIIDAHSTWGTEYFLLGGDTGTIPYHTANYDGDDIPTDTYYSDYDDDWTCEVNVGRASVTSTGNSAGGIGNFVNKSLNYEKNPPTTDFARNISLFGFDLDFWTDGEDCKIDIDNLYIPSSWDITKVYDSYSGNHENAVKAAVNAGSNLINHIDHCNEYNIGVGHHNHDWALSTSEVDAFSNADKQSIFYSIGCWAEAFDFSNCIAEHFVRDTNGGGVGFVGNTRYGWYYQTYDDYASLRYDRYFFRSFFNQDHYILGDLFSDHKMDAYFSMTQDDLNKYIFTELNLLGDPGLFIWTDDPVGLSTTHPSSIQTGTSSFTVHVEDSLGTDVENAYVCLWKGSEVYLTNYTDSSGDVTFSPSPTTAGLMMVTVTKKDYIPEISNVTVTTGGDTIPPVISDENLFSSDPIDTDPNYGWMNISCNVTDNIDVNQVFLNITCPDLTCSNVSMTKVEGTDKYFYETCFQQIGSYDYMICATDLSGNSCTTDEESYSMPPNWDVDMNGQTFLPDFVQISMKYGQTGPNGWIREDVDNNGQVFLTDFVQVSLHYGESWS